MRKRVMMWVGGMLLGSAWVGCSLALDFSETQDAGFMDPLCSAFEPNDVVSEATPGVLSIPQNAALCGLSDVDLFTVTLVEFDDLEATTLSSVDLQLSVRNELGLIESVDMPGGNETVQRTQALGNTLSPGTYYLAVEPSSQAGSNKEGVYSVTIEVTNNSSPITLRSQQSSVPNDASDASPP